MTELRRGQARTRRRWALGALGGTAAAVLIVATGNRIEHARRVEACNDMAAEIDEVWNAQQRRAVESAIRSTGLPYAEFTAAHVLARRRIGGVERCPSSGLPCTPSR